MQQSWWLITVISPNDLGNHFKYHIIKTFSTVDFQRNFNVPIVIVALYWHFIGRNKIWDVQLNNELAVLKQAEAWANFLNKLSVYAFV